MVPHRHNRPHDLSHAPHDGRYWRMLGVRWHMRPFDSGSHPTGGRWNPPGTPALYLSADHGTAIAEMRDDDPRLRMATHLHARQEYPVEPDAG